MAINKKGVFFTIAALLLTAAITVTAGYLGSRYTDKASVNVGRLLSMHNFIQNVADDLEVAMYTSAFRSLVAMQEHLSSTGEYIDDADQSIEELMMQGTLDNVSIYILENNTVPYWVSRMQEQASLVGLTFALTVTNVTVYQDDPWNVSIRVAYQLQINDSRQVTAYDFSGESISQVPITGFLEPLSIIETSNRVAVTINQTPYENDFVSNIDEHIQGNYFAVWPGAPSFLMRLEGNMNSSPYGIERFIDKIALADQDIIIDPDASSADHEYWSTAQPGYQFSIGPQFFRLDNQSVSGQSHIERYGLQNYIS